MKYVLLVFDSQKKANKRFRWLSAVLEGSQSVIRLSNPSMTIETVDTNYRFITQNDIDNVALKGLKFDRVVVDEAVSLSEEENIVLELISLESTMKLL